MFWFDGDFDLNDNGHRFYIQRQGMVPRKMGRQGAGVTTPLQLWQDHGPNFQPEQKSFNKMSFTRGFLPFLPGNSQCEAARI